MCLVERDEVPIESAFGTNLRHVLDCLIRCDTHIELAWLHLLFEDLGAMLLPWVQIDHAKLRRPAPELFHPVGDGALRCDHQMRLVSDQLCLPQVADEADRLNGLSEAHIIGKQTIHVIFIQSCHPFK